MLQYTHIWNLLDQIISLIIALLISVIVNGVCKNVFSFFGMPFENTWTETALYVLAFIGGITGTVFLFRGIDDFLYFRLSLGIPLTLAESKQCDFLIQTNFEDKWHTLEEITELPRDQRKDVLLALARSQRKALKTISIFGDNP